MNIKLQERDWGYKMAASEYEVYLRELITSLANELEKEEWDWHNQHEKMNSYPQANRVFYV